MAVDAIRLEATDPVEREFREHRNAVVVPDATQGRQRDGALFGIAALVLEEAIRRLTSIAEPDDAVITTVGAAHLEGLGDVSGVLEEKLDLVVEKFEQRAAALRGPDYQAAWRVAFMAPLLTGLGQVHDSPDADVDEGFRPDSGATGVAAAGIDPGEQPTGDHPVGAVRGEDSE